MPFVPIQEGRMSRARRLKFGPRRLMAGVVFVLASCSVMLWPREAAAQLDSSSFNTPTWYPVGFNNSVALAVGDLNNDGFADVVVTGQCYDLNCIVSHTGGIGVFINKGDGTFQPGPRYQTGADGSSTDQSIAIADMDGDGKPDLVVMNPGPPGSVSLLRGNGDGTFQDAVIYPLNTN